MCKVSVIIPVYNAERFLRECLDSLCAQTLKDFEVICVDDGSTDQSFNILSEYSAKDSRFVVIRQNNLGAGSARNKGFKHAKGEYVVFLDCDDFFSSVLLEKIWNAGKEHQADIVLFDAQQYDDKTGKVGRKHPYLQSKNLPSNKVFSGEDIPTKIFVVTSPAPWLRALRANFVREKKIEYQNLPNSNDYLFTQLAMAEANRICAVHEDLVFYRINNADSLQGKRIRNNLCFAQAIEALYDELNKRGLYDKYRVSFIHSALGGFNDKIRNSKSVLARQEIFQYMLTDSFQRMGLLGNDMEYYGGSWLFGLASEQYELLKWYSRHQKQSIVKETKVVVSRKSDQCPLVSVVIPMYNVELYAEEALDSISSQTLKNIEIICVNDGSTDKTLDVVTLYAKKESRMSVYSHPNSGLSATRNAGLIHAQGKYVYFFDGDDVLDKDALSELSSIMEKEELDMALFDADVLAEDAESGKSFVYKRKKHYQGIYTGPDLYTVLKKNDEYYSCAVMYMLRTAFLQENKLEFHRAILHEDQPFTFQTMMLAKRASHIQKQFYKRRVHADSIMTRNVSFANVHGLFHGYMDMSTALMNHAAHLTQEQKLAFSEHAAGVLGTMQRQYAELASAQQYCRFTLGEFEPVFRDLVVRGYDESVRLHQEIERKKFVEQKLLKQIQELVKKNQQMNEETQKLGNRGNVVIHPSELLQTTKIPERSIARNGITPSETKQARVKLQTEQGSKVKKLIKRIAPVTYSRSEFEAQVIADLVSRQAEEILKNQALMEKKHEARFAMLEEQLQRLQTCHQHGSYSIKTLAAMMEKMLIHMEERLNERIAALESHVGSYDVKGIIQQIQSDEIEKIAAMVKSVLTSFEAQWNEWMCKIDSESGMTKNQDIPQLIQEQHRSTMR